MLPTDKNTTTEAKSREYWDDRAKQFAERARGISHMLLWYAGFL